MDAIAADGLIKEFDGLYAVNGVTFGVHTGEIFGFLGPNGAGKTTTVRMINGVLKPDAGTARIGGVSVGEAPITAKAKVGIAPEEANVYTDLTARGNMHLAGELYDVPKGQLKADADRLLDVFGLLERADSKVKGFSKGMKKRLVLAMALVHDPPILFLDEPTSGLDVASQQIIRDQIKELNGEGKTVFLTTHNISEADRLCDRVAVIDKGEIATVDSPERLKSTFESTQSVRVSFAGGHLSPSLLDGLATLESVQTVDKEGDKLRLYGSNPGDMVENIVEFAKSENLKIRSLNTIGPSLEDVFTYLTTKREQTAGPSETP